MNKWTFIEFRDTLDGCIAHKKNSRLPVYRVIKVAGFWGIESMPWTGRIG